ncbi:hypothetical protein HY500_02840 [Candidatus Woesearchaeota archaeon]|nr:hypothetical protein [Candidatus Woesearchaeota archaeon]
MAKKERKHAPKCEGRFGELRGVFYETAREMRALQKDPLWSIVTGQDLTDFIEFAWGGGIESTFLFDAIDPYFMNKRDELRGDPLAGDVENFELALIPFIHEAIRETLYENVQKARSLIQSIQAGGDNDLALLETEELTHTPIEELERLSKTDLCVTILEPIAERDFTITQNSVYPTLLERYARLYLEQGDIDKLNLMHRGVDSLDRELGISMHKILVPTVRKDTRAEYASLSGYSLKAEFGTGPNTSRTLISSAPYRIELYKKGKDGSKDEIPVFGMNFYLRHPDLMVISQIQDIRGARVPEGTTDGLCGLILAEKIAKLLNLKGVVTYNHRTNPVLYIYSGEEKLASVLKINFDEAARRLLWEPISHDGRNHVIGYKRTIE